MAIRISGTNGITDGAFDYEDEINSKATKTYVDSKPSGFKNYIINGGFDVWQRGTSFTSGEYTADRFIHYGAGLELSNASSNGARYSASLASSISPQIAQRIEGYKEHSGKTYTISAWFSDVPQLFFWLDSDLNVNTLNPTLIETDGAWKRYSSTFSVPYEDSPSNDYLEVRAVCIANKGSNTNITQLQLEEGSVATPFENRPYGLELSLCQRYYEIVHCFDVATAQNYNSIPFGYKHKKRITPTAYCTTPNGQVGAMQGDSVVFSANVFTDEYAGRVTVGNVYIPASTFLGAYVYADAEL